MLPPQVPAKVGEELIRKPRFPAYRVPCKPFVGLLGCKCESPTHELCGLITSLKGTLMYERLR